ncbi:MAG: response regulator transcription factor [Chloroflexaceae bacterium]|nr:response regulator transcription factor [Chloroflexaceae bacterium]
MRATTIVLVHDHALFREGLRCNLVSFPEFCIVGEASHGQQAIKLVAEVDPDLVVMKVDLPGVSGLEISRVLKRNHPHVRIILLGSSMDGPYVVKAIRAGVAAYVQGNVSWDVLLATIREVCAGSYPINELVLSMKEVASQVLETFRHMAVDREAQHIYSPLSTRELQVLELVANEQTNKEIASSLDISSQTVKNHISSILRKLAVNDRTQAVLYAVRQGWIRCDTIE